VLGFSPPVNLHRETSVQSLWLLILGHGKSECDVKWDRGMSSFITWRLLYNFFDECLTPWLIPVCSLYLEGGGCIGTVAYAYLFGKL